MNSEKTVVLLGGSWIRGFEGKNLELRTNFFCFLRSLR